MKASVPHRAEDTARPGTPPAPSAGARVLLAYSGGLDTSFLVAWLTRERGFRVTTLTVDCGGFSEEEKRAIAERARAFGALEHKTIDARALLFERVIRWLIAGNVRRGGTYPLCVAAERGLQAELLARDAAAGGFDAVAHGCTGAGNDQVRFEAALRIVAEDLVALAPIRDHAFARAEEQAWLADNGFPLPDAAKGRYSINQGLWGVSIGGGETLSSAAPLAEEAWRWTARARRVEGERELAIAFERGVPVALDGRAQDPVTLIETLNELAGSYGVGRGYHLGDTVLGIKGRIGYEAPAAEVLLDAHRELEKLVLTEDQRTTKDELAALYGRRLHQGLLFEPLLRDMEAFFASSQERVTGTVRVRLSETRALVVGLDSPFSMMAASDALYGERPAASWDPAGAVGFARVLAEPARLFRKAGLAGGKPADQAPSPAELRR